MNYFTTKEKGNEKMEMNTLTSQYNASELYDLVSETVVNAGSGGVMFVTETDIITHENGRLYILHTKEIKGENFEISRKEIDPYTLYLLFDLFENAIDEHLIRKEQ